MRDPETAWEQVVEKHEQATYANRHQLDRVIALRRTLQEDFLRARRLLVEGARSEDDWEVERLRIINEDAIL